MGDQRDALRLFVEYIVKNLVDNPSAVAIKIHGDNELILEIRVAKEDVGKVVGRRGQTIKALRLISSLTAQRVGCRVRLDVCDDEKQKSKEQETQEQEMKEQDNVESSTCTSS